MDFVSIAACGFLTLQLNIISGFLIYYSCKEFALKVKNEIELKIRNLAKSFLVLVILSQALGLHTVPPLGAV